MLGADFPGHVNCLIKREMRMVRLVSHRVEGNMFQPLQFCKFPVRQQTHVRNIRNFAESESQNRHFVMHSPDGNDFDALSCGRFQLPGEIRVLCILRLRYDVVIRRSRRTVRILIAISHVMHPDEFPVLITRLHKERPFVNEMYVPFRSSGILPLRENIVEALLERIQDRLLAIDFSSPLVNVIQ